MTQAYNLSQLANNLDSSGRLDATDGLVNAVPVTNGGTGASSVAAAVSNLSASIYPVGSIYINAAVSTNPATLLGFGTWVSFGTGRVLIGVDSADSAFDVLGETGGSKDAIVVSHSHTFSGNTNGAGAHSHSIPTGAGGGTDQFTSQAYTNYQVADRYTNGVGDHTHSFSGTTANQGSSGTNANLPPYVTVYMWRRMA
jgi:hypothetical protein